MLEAVGLVRRGLVYDLAHVLHEDIPAFPGDRRRAVCAGLLSVLIFPLIALALALLRRNEPDPAAIPAATQSVPEPHHNLGRVTCRR